MEFVRYPDRGQFPPFQAPRKPKRIVELATREGSPTNCLQRTEELIVTGPIGLFAILAYAYFGTRWDSAGEGRIGKVAFIGLVRAGQGWKG